MAATISIESLLFEEVDDAVKACGLTGAQEASSSLDQSELNFVYELASSFHPSTASLGALALANIGEPSALPILLTLADESSIKIRTRIVRGLLYFIDQSMVRQKLEWMMLNDSEVNIATRA